MRAVSFIALFGAAALAAPVATSCTSSIAVRETPFTFPIANGFPNLSDSALAQVEQQAHGELPNSKLPDGIADRTATVFSLIAFNEFFEVAFFSDLLANITAGVTGYRVGDPGLPSAPIQSSVIEVLTQILAVEQLHNTGANKILSAASRTPIQPCRYTFPSATFVDAIAFASTFTDVVLGTLQSAIHTLALDGDVDFTNLLASVIGDEAEQEAWFRIAQASGLSPVELPFLTASSGPFAFSALNQGVVVPGSCPSLASIPIPILKPLNIATKNLNSNTTSIEFSIAASSTDALKGLSLVYVNQQLLRVVVGPQAVAYANGQVTFTAPFSASMDGLTIAALTTSAGPFADADAVAAAAVFGPGLIEFD
ncbi:hypothetical protein ANO11243_055540 [Dothideomycetidae sp. 11243]|nr:hypothetical protein ANO11243_055540 [fungal sp. No.11243]